jgi:hypothetical protein
VTCYPSCYPTRGILSACYPKHLIFRVPAVRIELTTYRLQGGCSTAELSRLQTVIAEPGGRFKQSRRDAFGLNSVPVANVIER